MVTKTKTAEEYEKQKEELMEKKKQANLQAQTVAPGTVIQSDEVAKKDMQPHEKMQHDIKRAIELAKQGTRNPKVRGD